MPKLSRILCLERFHFGGFNCNVFMVDARESRLLVLIEKSNLYLAPPNVLQKANVCILAL